MAIDRRDLLRQLEGPYLLDYALFTGALREYVTRTLEGSFARDGSLTHRRLFLIAIFREEYSAYEDLGAMLDALLSASADPATPLLDRLISYKPGEVELVKVMTRHAVASARDLHDRLGFDRLVPPPWSRSFPDLDLAKTLRLAAAFFFDDCLRNQKREGVRAFNKMKHGLMWVPSGRLYVGGDVDAPAAVFETDKGTPEAASDPLTVYSVPMADAQIEERLRVIHFTQTSLRLITVLRTITLHADTLATRGFSDPLSVMQTPPMADVMAYIQKVSRRRDGANSDPTRISPA